MKPLGPLILLSALLLLVTGCDLEAEKASDAERLIREAQRIVIESAGQPEAQEHALAKLSEAISIDPDQAPAYRLRAGIFLELDRRERARNDLKKAYTVSGSATDLLPYCILDEQAYGWRSEARSCYQQVVTLLEEGLATEAYQDLNYLTALRLAESEQFEEMVERFFEENRSEWTRDVEQFHEWLLLRDGRDIAAEFLL